MKPEADRLVLHQSDDLSLTFACRFKALLSLLIHECIIYTNNQLIFGIYNWNKSNYILAAQMRVMDEGLLDFRWLWRSEVCFIKCGM